jgi:hypothetical protein
MEHLSFRQLVESASDMYDKVNFKTTDLYNEPAPDPIVSRKKESIIHSETKDCIS